MWGRQPAEDRGTHHSPESHQSKHFSLLIFFNRTAVNELISGKCRKCRPYDGSVTAQGHRGPPGTKTHLTVLTLWIKSILFSLIQSFSWISFFSPPSRNTCCFTDFVTLRRRYKSRIRSLASWFKAVWHADGCEARSERCRTPTDGSRYSDAVASFPCDLSPPAAALRKKKIHAGCGSRCSWRCI